MGLATLGKRVHKVMRPNSLLGGQWVDGEYVESVYEEINIYANIQPSTLSYRTKLLPEGDSEREAIAIYSDDWLHVAQTGATNIKADKVAYRGALWEVVVCKPYGNFGNHCEALALKVDDSLTLRSVGKMETPIN